MLKYVCNSRSLSYREIKRPVPVPHKRICNIDLRQIRKHVSIQTPLLSPVRSFNALPAYIFPLTRSHSSPFPHKLNPPAPIISNSIPARP